MGKDGTVKIKCSEFLGSTMRESFYSWHLILENNSYRISFSTNPSSKPRDSKETYFKWNKTENKGDGEEALKKIKKTMKMMRSNTSVITAHINELSDPFLIKVFALCQKIKLNHTLFTIFIPETKWCAKIKMLRQGVAGRCNKR